ncbi:MAG TPA: hypothetical protein VE618_08540, partial [Myxococcaceae bacterium]|nr:hypothetical protein [Myxococcaceae bacterium]
MDDGTSANGAELERVPAVARRSGRGGRAWRMWLALWALNFLLFAPSFAFRQGHRDFFPFRISYEFGLILAALALASRFGGRALARLAGTVTYAALLLFLTYDHAVP